VRDEVLGSRRSARNRQRRESLEAAVEEIGAQLASLPGRTCDWLRKEMDALRRRGDDKES